MSSIDPRIDQCYLNLATTIVKGIPKVYNPNLNFYTKGQGSSNKGIDRYNKLSQEEKDTLALALSKSRNFASEESKNRNCLKVIKTGISKLSFPEALLGLYLENSSPGRWLYNGQGQQDIAVGGQIPDFIDRDRLNCIAVFGEYWHKTYIGREVEIIELYGDRGWFCNILWEADIYLLLGDYSFKLINTIIKG